MNPVEYDILAARTTQQVSEPLAFYALGVAGESGELVDRIKKSVYHARPLSQTEILDEVGDVLWYLTGLCRCYGFNLGDAMAYNVEKLKKRYPEKYTHEDSLARVDYASTNIPSRPKDH